MKKYLIDRDVIEALIPCNSRFDNYLKFYGDKKLTKAQFMGRKNITQSDKMWVAFRLMPRDNVRLAAADIAELVLHLYEGKYPNDNRPRKAIEAARNGDKNAAYAAAAYAAAYAADAAYAAAYAAYAAAYAAYVAADAAYAAAYAAYVAADAAYAAACTRGSVEKQIRKIVLKYWKELK